MKTCLICHHESPTEAATCPRCGEATWSGPSVRMTTTVREVAEITEARASAERKAPAVTQQQLRKGNRR